MINQNLQKSVDLKTFSSLKKKLLYDGNDPVLGDMTSNQDCN